MLPAKPQIPHFTCYLTDFVGPAAAVTAAVAVAPPMMHGSGWVGGILPRKKSSPATTSLTPDLHPNVAAAAEPPPSTLSEDGRHRRLRRRRPTPRRREKGEDGGILRESPTTVVTPIRIASRERNLKILRPPAFRSTRKKIWPRNWWL